MAELTSLVSGDMAEGEGVVVEEQEEVMVCFLRVIIEVENHARCAVVTTQIYSFVPSSLPFCQMLAGSSRNFPQVYARVVCDLMVKKQRLVMLQVHGLCVRNTTCTSCYVIVLNTNPSMHGL